MTPRWTSFETVIQICIGVLGALVIILVARKNKWGFVFGLTSQPFWLVTIFMHEQWGMFALSLFYLYGWGDGVRRWFWKIENVKAESI